MLRTFQDYLWYDRFYVISLGLWMTWMTLRHELRALDTMNDSRLWLTSMNLIRELKALDAMKSSRFGWYEYLNVVDGISDSGSHELTTLDAMNNLGLRMTLMILSVKPMTLNAMNSSELWLTWMNPGHELKLKAMVDMKNLGCEPRALDVMKSLGLWMTWATPGY